MVPLPIYVYTYICEPKQKQKKNVFHDHKQYRKLIWEKRKRKKQRETNEPNRSGIKINLFVKLKHLFELIYLI